MAKIELVIAGNPVAQGRPRFVKATGRAYDPAKSRDNKAYISQVAAVEMRDKPPLEGALALAVRVYRPIPKGMSKKKAALAEAGEIRPITKPDTDNYVKGIKDALKGICWRDDSQVVDLMAGKWYSVKPRVEIAIVETEGSKNE